MSMRHLITTAVVCTLVLILCGPISAGADAISPDSDSPAITDLTSSGTGTLPAAALALNLSYWQASSTLPTKSQHHGYSIVQLPSLVSASYPDEIIIIGGFRWQSFTVLNETWKSVDEGNSWTQVGNPALAFPAQTNTGACLTPESHIILVGGITLSNQTRESYVSSDRGVSWQVVSSNQPFTTRSPECGFDSTGKYVFVWLKFDFDPTQTQLFRGRYTGSSIVDWVPIITSSADGQPLIPRMLPALRFLPQSNQLLIGGGIEFGLYSPIVKEVLSLTLPTSENQTVANFTRTVVTSDWPMNVSYCSFTMDSDQNLYIYMPLSYFPTVPTYPEYELWMAASKTAYDSWIPIDQNSSCSREWDDLWVGTVELLSSTSGGIDRFLMIDTELDNPTILIALDHLNEPARSTLSNETFTPITVCTPPDEPSDPSRLSWAVCLAIGVAAAIVIAGATYYCHRRGTKAAINVNTPLLNDV